MQLEKKGVSAMVGYVLLIVVITSLSVAVFMFLRLYVPPAVPECDPDVSIRVDTLSCTGGQLAIALTNDGLFSIEGVQVRAGDADRIVRTFVNEADFQALQLIPGEGASVNYAYTPPPSVTSVEVEFEPTQLGEANEIILCAQAVVAQTVQCT